MTIILWPIIPLFWIPVHGLSRIIKRIGLLTYVTPLLTWLPLAYLIYRNRTFVLQFKINPSVILSITGITLLVLGTLLHVWTGQLLGLWGLVGLPEVSTKIKGELTTRGPFAVVRHPTYFAHVMMFSGIFLMTGVIAIGIITLLDFLLVYIIIIPLEEKELLNRFGEGYRLYKKRVPKFFPRTHFYKKVKSTPG